eukprot:jgi/Chlat1/2776/Chrsp187S02947
MEAGARKKRAPDTQLTKDDVERADASDEEDEEERDGGEGQGTWNKASSEVLATRRIVKARRPAVGTGGASIASPAGGAAANPFAGIKLAAGLTAATAFTPVEPIAQQPAPEAPKKEVAESSAADAPAEPAGAPNDSERSHLGTSTVAAAASLTTTASTGEAVAQGSVLVREDTKDTQGTVAKGTEDGKPPGSFSQHSALPNAFASPFGSSFASSASSVPAFSSSATGSGFPSLSSVFGQSNGSRLQLFGQAGTSSTDAPSPSPPAPFGTGAPAAPAPAVQMANEPVLTGEESEESVFTGDAVLYEFADGGQWRERGRGELRLNVHKEQDQAVKPRLIMRAKGNLRLLLNAALYPGMKLTKMDGRGVSFACINSVGGEGERTLRTYAVRLPDKEQAEAFHQAVSSHRPGGGETDTKDGHASNEQVSKQLEQKKSAEGSDTQQAESNKQQSDV